MRLGTELCHRASASSAVLSAGTASNGMLIPQAAVARDPKGAASVMVVGAKGVAEPRPITVSQTVGPNWLVTGGLKPGDCVRIARQTHAAVIEVLFAAGEAQYQLPRGFDDGRVCGGSPRGHLHLPA